MCMSANVSKHVDAWERLTLDVAAAAGRDLRRTVPDRVESRLELVGRSHRSVGIAVGLRSILGVPGLAVTDTRVADSHLVLVADNIVGLVEVHRTAVEDVAGHTAADCIGYMGQTF
jgi:hypothetical protein